MTKEREEELRKEFEDAIKKEKRILAVLQRVQIAIKELQKEREKKSSKDWRHESALEEQSIALIWDSVKILEIDTHPNGFYPNLLKKIGTGIVLQDCEFEEILKIETFLRQIPGLKIMIVECPEDALGHKMSRYVIHVS